TNAALPAPVCVPLTNSTSDCNQWKSNFVCNPSRIDGISVVNSSQGGGGIFVHGWGHFLEVSNNRVKANGGTIAGGISVGNAESDPGGLAADGVTMLPGLLDTHVNMHNNPVTQNAAYGDELNSPTTMGAGGVTFCTG